MKKSTIKSNLFVTIFLIVVLAANTLMLTMPAASALPIQQTWAYISITPNPVGVGQSSHIRMSLQPFPPTAADFFHNFQYTITGPDGSVVKTQQGLTSDGNGAYDFDFTPSVTGNYTIQFSYPGEDFKTATDIGSSTTAILTAQQNAVQSIPDAPLPDGYWTRPVSEDLRSWSSISGNWLTQGYDASGRMYADTTGFNPYTQPILAPHVMWVQPVTTGGLIGGSYGPDGYYTGIQYNGEVTPPLVINGRLYYRLFMSSSGEKGNVPGFASVDLRTGQEYWRNTNATINFAQIYNSKGYNGQGGLAMLYDTSTSTSSWTIFDAFTGTQLYTFTGASMGNPDKVFFGPLGEVYAVKVGGNLTQPWVAMWNSTKAFQSYGFLSGGTFQGPGRINSYNWTAGLQYNLTMPSTAPFTFSQSGPHNMPADSSTNTIMLVATPADKPNNGSSTETGVNALTGQVLWGPTRRDFNGTFTNRVATGGGVYVQLDAASLTRLGIDVTTGSQLWVSPPTVAPWGQYSGFGANAYGMSYQGSYSGYLVALNLTTGKQVWSFSGGSSGLETPYGGYPMFNGPVVGGGVVYAGYSEHTPNEPLYRGAQLFALDAYTGKEIWSMPAYLTVKALADGYLVTFNAYDNQIYVLGKGPSATTVSAPNTQVTVGSTITITGTVTDQSPGGLKGTPAISDASMGDWMAYEYMQKPIPANATGVPVQLIATGPNNQNITIGTVTSDISGRYGCQWTPPAAGLWTIKAVFAGSGSYGGSFDQTYMAVSPAPTANPISTPATPTASPTSAPTSIATPTASASAIASASPSPVVNPKGTTGTVTYIIIAAVVIIAVLAAVAVLLRRHK